MGDVSRELGRRSAAAMRALFLGARLPEHKGVISS
jgi:hypothetical protein